MFGVEEAQFNASVELEGLPTEKEPGAVGGVATCTVVVAVLVPLGFVAVIV